MKNFKLISLCLLFTGILFAQDLQKSISDFKTKHKASVTINDVSGVVEFVMFSKNNELSINGSTLNEKALNFLNTNKAIYNMKEVNTSFTSLKTEEDNYGFNRVVLEQNHNGVPVYDGKLLFHFNIENEITAINGNYISNIKLNSEPSLSKTKAHAIALQEIETQNINYSGESLFVHDSKLYVFNKGLARGIPSANYLVYEVEVRNDTDVREFLFVDAHTGVLVEQYTGIAHAIDRVVYEDNISNVVWEEGDAFPGALTIWQQNEVVASGHVYHFFNNAFGFASYDGADAQMITINNNSNINCPNANWNGVTANYCNGTASDDVIAHEWGHAYTDSTNNLIYQWESGAINESYSDIWGETIDLLNNYEDAGEDNSIRTSSNCGPSNRWKIAEDATAFGSNIRDMWNPNCKGDPGKLTDNQYLCGTADNGGVHINSGIPNHAYALLVDGGTFNGQTITGIGFTKAAHIFWRAQSQYLTATSDFNNLADALEASANDLIGIDLEGLTTEATPVGASGEIITASDVTQLLNTLIAVELRAPNSCGYQPILASTADLCEAANNSPIFFEDWESGMGSWTLDQIIAPTAAATWTPRDWEIETSLPDDRTGSAIYAINAPIGDLYGGDCSSDFQNGILRLESPIITMPDFSNGTYELAFDHYVHTEPNWDGGNLKISVDGGAFSILPGSAFISNPYNGVINDQAAGNDNPMRGQVAYTGSDQGANKGSWGRSIIDLSSLGITGNSTLQIRFDFGSDGCNGREGWFVDEFVVYNCAYVLSTKEFNTIHSLVKVYPNPSKGVFNLKKIGQESLLKAEIYDINGRFIKAVDLSKMISDKVIDLSQVASGLYFMTVKSKNSQGVIKLLKQ